MNIRSWTEEGALAFGYYENFIRFRLRRYKDAAADKDIIADLAIDKTMIAHGTRRCPSLLPKRYVNLIVDTTRASYFRRQKSVHCNYVSDLTSLEESWIKSRRRSHEDAPAPISVKEAVRLLLGRCRSAAQRRYVRVLCLFRKAQGRGVTSDQLAAKLNAWGGNSVVVWTGQRIRKEADRGMQIATRFRAEIISCLRNRV